MPLKIHKLSRTRLPRCRTLPWHLCCGAFVLILFGNILCFTVARFSSFEHFDVRDIPTVPPISDHMGSVLASLGYTVHEEYRWHNIHVNHVNLTFMTIFSGLARVCHNELYMRWVLGSCIEGLSSMTFLLQDVVPVNMSTEFSSYLDVCISQISYLTRGTRCSLIVGQQTYSVDETKGCPRQSNKHLQYISLARSVEWATSAFPPHEYYVRARLDAPWCLPVNIGPEPFIAMNHYKILASDHLTSLFPSDRYAIVPRSLLPYYFDAWKLWSPLDCSNNPLFMSSGNTSANQMNWGSGEAVLSAHMNMYYDKFKWMRVTWSGDPVVRQVNETHVRLQHDESAMTYRTFLAKARTSRDCHILESGNLLTLRNGTWN
jgi:hypothetical protein